MLEVRRILIYVFLSNFVFILMSLQFYEFITEIYDLIYFVDYCWINSSNWLHICVNYYNNSFRIYCYNFYILFIHSHFYTIFYILYSIFYFYTYVRFHMQINTYDEYVGCCLGKRFIEVIIATVQDRNISHRKKTLGLLGKNLYA